jgi:hypothetical protein
MFDFLPSISRLIKTEIIEPILYIRNSADKNCKLDFFKKKKRERTLNVIVMLSLTLPMPLRTGNFNDSLFCPHFRGGGQLDLPLSYICLSVRPSVLFCVARSSKSIWLSHETLQECWSACVVVHLGIFVRIYSVFLELLPLI